MYKFFCVRLADGRFYSYSDDVCGPKFCALINEAWKFRDIRYAESLCLLLKTKGLNCHVASY